MLAPGAIACAYSTSSDVSCAHPTISGRLVALNGGIGPFGWRIVKFGGGGMSKDLSNVFNSCPMPLKPYESTITIVSPAPFMPRLYSGPRLYAFWNWKGA